MQEAQWANEAYLCAVRAAMRERSTCRLSVVTEDVSENEHSRFVKMPNVRPVSKGFVTVV